MHSDVRNNIKSTITKTSTYLFLHDSLTTSINEDTYICLAGLSSTIVIRRRGRADASASHILEEHK